MNDATKLGLYIVGAMLLLGMLGDGLLRTEAWGLNVLLWTGAFSAVIVALARKKGMPLTGSMRRLIPTLLFFAAAIAWRDSPTLKALDLLALLVTLSLTAVSLRAGPLFSLGALGYAAHVFRAGGAALFGSFALFGSDISWNEMPRGSWMRYTLAVVRGLLIVLPLLLLFGGLLMSADAVFAHMIGSVFQVNLGNAWSHFVVILIVSWLVGGFLQRTFLAREDAALVKGSPLALGLVETSVILGLLNVLFFSFVVVQLRYFFGGAALLHVTTGLTYAEYARQGFFELVWVSILVLPLLLVLHTLLRKDQPGGERLYHWLAGAQVALLFVIMASAVKRMLLYQSEYGLTELRFYTMAFMGWLAAVFLWFCLTVLRGQRQRFALGALIAGGTMLAALHILNPDDAIVRANVARSQTTHTFDVEYNTSLSADAVPELAAAGPRLPPAARSSVGIYLTKTGAGPADRDWRDWSWGRAQAQRATRGISH